MYLNYCDLLFQHVIYRINDYMLRRAASQIDAFALVCCMFLLRRCN